MVKAKYTTIEIKKIVKALAETATDKIYYTTPMPGAHCEIIHILICT